MIQLFKGIDIIASYCWLLIATYYLEWEPFSIFLSYLIEMVVVLAIYFVVRMIDGFMQPKKYYNQQSVIMIVFAAGPLILIQYFIIGLVTNEIDITFDFFNKSNLFLSKEVLFTCIVITAFYLMRFFTLKSISHAEEVIKQDFFLIVFSLFVTNTVGMLVVYLIGIHTLLPVLVILVILRSIIELKLNRKIVELEK